MVSDETLGNMDPEINDEMDDDRELDSEMSNEEPDTDVPEDEIDVDDRNE